MYSATVGGFWIRCHLQVLSEKALRVFKERHGVVGLKFSRGESESKDVTSESAHRLGQPEERRPMIFPLVGSPFSAHKTNHKNEFIYLFFFGADKLAYNNNICRIGFSNSISNIIFYFHYFFITFKNDGVGSR
jgi:hypothetical protein